VIARTGQQGTMSTLKDIAAAGHAHTLRFPQLDREIEAQPGETIFQCARRNGVRIVGACGGRGVCGTCTVLISKGEVQNADGRIFAPRAGKDGRPGRGRWLRACQVVPRSDCTIDVEERSLAPIVRAEADIGGREFLEVDPIVVHADIAVTAASLHDTLSDAERVARGAPMPITSLDLVAARELPVVLRDGGWSVRARVRGGEAIGFAPVTSPTLGLAVDLGTTNVAGFLVDLDSGERLASLGIENPQVAWGADVISRINYAIRDAAAAEQLRQAAIAAIAALAHDLCRSLGARPSDISDMTICGNTAMHHLLLGLPVRQLGLSPFVAAVSKAMDVKARDLGVVIAPGAYVHLGPNIGGFVGSDHVTALLATQAQWSSARTSIVMDIGTNTEISLVHRGEIVTASCPSGPALEGGHISCGMRAAEGAIERVEWKDGHIALGVIGDKRPIGLCGSGVLDAVAMLRAAGLVDDGGRLVGGRSEIRDVDGRRVVELAPAVTFSQADVRAVQLAKAAIQTGVELLLSEAGLVKDEIERFIIAGAFGSYLDVRSGIAIGLFPQLPLDRFDQIGNAAGLGVRQMLASRRARTRAAELAATCRYVELSTRREFQKVFLRNIGFRAPSHGEHRDRPQWL